jgi:predicted kinase
LLADARRVVILIGLPGSGKSTWAARQPYAAISTDELRRWLRDDATDQTIHRQVFAMAREFLRRRMELGAQVSIVDATSLLRKHRRPFIKLAAMYGCECEAIWFKVSLDECLRRNAARARRVPEDVIVQLAARLQPPTFDEGFRRITVIATDGAQTTTTPPEST